METLLWFGGEIKSLDNGHFGGHLVRFTSADNKDLAGDFFTKDTDFGFTTELKSPVYFNHRLPLKTSDGKQIIVKSQIGEATLTLDEEGVLIDAILFNRNKYEKAIIAAGKGNKLGWSSGTAKHLVDREASGEIKKWPLGLDASATPIPCEPQNAAIESKSIEAVKFAPLDEILVIEEEDLLSEHDNESTINPQKSVFNELEDLPAGSRFLDHLEVVLAAAQEVQTRAKSIHELRVKSGRVLSEANRKRLTKLLEGLVACSGDIDTLLKDTNPPEKSVDPDLVRGAMANFNLIKRRYGAQEINHGL